MRRKAPKRQGEGQNSAFRDRKGVTLVETVVSLLLTVLIVALSAVSILNCYQLYGRVKARDRAIELSAILCDDITATLSACYGHTTYRQLRLYHYGGPDAQPVGSEEEVSAYLPYDENIDLVAFQESTGNNAYLTVKDGKVTVFYPESPSVTEWSFGEDAYHGLDVTALHVSQVDSSSETHLVLKFTVTVANDDGSCVYTMTRYVRCENILPAEDPVTKDAYCAVYTYTE